MGAPAPRASAGFDRITASADTVTVLSITALAQGA